MDVPALTEALRAVQRLIFIQTVDTVHWMRELEKIAIKFRGVARVFDPGGVLTDSGPDKDIRTVSWGYLKEKPLEASQLAALLAAEVSEDRLVQGLNSIIQAPAPGDFMALYILPVLGTGLTDRGIDRIKAISFQAEADVRTHAVTILISQDSPPVKATSFLHVITDRGPTPDEIRDHVKFTLEQLRAPTMIDVEPLVTASAGYSFMQIESAIGLALARAKSEARKLPLPTTDDWRTSLWTLMPNVFPAVIKGQAPAYGQSS